MGYEHFLEHPSEQRFYNYVAIVGGCLALNTDVWDWYQRPLTKWYDVQRYVMIISIPINIMSQLAYIWMHYKDYEFTELAGMFCVWPMYVAVAIKLALTQTVNYKGTMRNFMSKMHLHNFLSDEMSEDRVEFVVKELIGAERFIRWTFRSLTLHVVCCSAWNVVPIIHNIKNNSTINNNNVRLEVFVHYWLPFDYEYNFYAYISVLVLGLYCGAIAVALFILFDTINFSCIYHLVGHIKILKYDLEFGFKGNISEHEKTQKLVHITKYYCFIIKSFKDVESAFEYSVLGIYLQNLIQSGLLLYQVMSSDMDAETIFTYGLMITILTGTLTCMSLVLENIRIQAEDIPALVYDLPWESMSVPNQKMVLLILSQVQPPLEFKAAFNTKTGVQPAINILRAAFSYYIMISQSREMKK